MSPSPPALQISRNRSSPAADDVIAEQDRRVDSGEQRLQPVLALDVWQASDVLAAIDEQVEGVEGKVLAARFLERRLEQLEVGLSVFIQRDCFAVDQAACGQVRGRLHRARNLSLQSLPLRVQAVAAPVPVAIRRR